MMSKALKTVAMRALRCLAGAAGVAAAAVLLASPALAQGQGQGQIWRCGNEFTNQPGERPEARGCRLVTGGNLSIVEGRRAPATAAATAAPPGAGAAPGTARAATPAPSAPAGASATSAGGAGSAAGARSSAERVERELQQARDRDARLILEAELRRARASVADLQAEFNQGRPAPLPSERGDEARLRERTEELRRRLERAQGDVAAIERELQRLPTPPAPQASAAPSAGVGAGPGVGAGRSGGAGSAGAATAASPSAAALTLPGSGQFISLPAAPRSAP